MMQGICCRKEPRRQRSRRSTDAVHTMHKRTTGRLVMWPWIMILSTLVSAQDQNPLTMNGGSVLAMAGKDCVALAVDKRFASGPQMVNIAPRHVYIPSQELMVAFTGLEGDVQSLSQDLEFQVASKLGRGLGFMNENRQQRPVISPRAMASLTSHVLYNRRQAPYYVEPLVVGLTEVTSRKHRAHAAARTTKTMPDEQDDVKPRQPSKCYVPFLCSMDMIGAKSVSRAFVCAGAASDSIFGTAEALWKEGLEKDELVEICANAFLSALERDCLSGYGATVYLITRDGITEYDLASRND